MVHFAMPARAGAAGAGLVLAMQSGALAAPCPCGKIEAYVDCSATENGKGTRESPYTSLTEVNRLTFKAGDSIHLKRGARCKGTLAPKGSGGKSDPIVIGPYGDGDAAPVIDAAGGEQAVLLAGSLNVRMSGLELTAPGDGTRPRRGVYVYAQDIGTVRGIELTGLDIHDVRGQLPGKAQQPKEAGAGAGASGGIVVEAQGGATPTAFDGVKIAGNRIHGVDRAGISTWSNWCKRPEVQDKAGCTQAWTPIRRLTVQGNLLWDIGGDGISVVTAHAPVIKGNRLEGFNERTGAFGAGVTVANVKSAVISGNDVSGGTGTTGGMAYVVGRATDGAALTANLSHDNQGGFVQLCAARDFAVHGNVSVNDRARAFMTCDAPLAGGQVYGNTAYIGDGIDQLVVDADTAEKLDVRFTGNLITRSGKTGTVGWNLDSTAWTIDHNLLDGVPVPATATGTVKADPALLAPGLADPVAYQVLAGSPVLGAAGKMPETGGYPVSPAQVPEGSPSIGGVQAPAAFPATLVASFDKDAAAKPPEGWQVTGAVTVAADPAGFAGNALAIARGVSAATALRTFPATGGDLRVRARLRADQADQPLWLRVLDGKGGALADVGLSATGRLRFTDGGDVRDSGVVYPAKAWVPVSLLLRPEHRTYEISVGGTKVAEGALAPGGGIAGQLAVVAPGGAGEAAFAVDDVLVTPELCVEKPAHPAGHARA